MSRYQNAVLLQTGEMVTAKVVKTKSNVTEISCSYKKTQGLHVTCECQSCLCMNCWLLWKEGWCHCTREGSFQVSLCCEAVIPVTEEAEAGQRSVQVSSDWLSVTPPEKKKNWEESWEYSSVVKKLANKPEALVPTANGNRTRYSLFHP